MGTSTAVRRVPVRSVAAVRWRPLLAVALALALAVVTLSGQPAVAAGPAVTLSVTAPARATAGTAFSVTVTARDAAGAVATSYRGRVRFTSTDTRSPVLPAAYTFTAADAGRRTFTGVRLFTAGARTIAASDTVASGVKGRSGTIAVAAGKATRLALTAPASTTAGVPVTVTVSARDAWSNVAPTYRGTVYFHTSDGWAVLPPAYTFTSEDRGVRAFPGVEPRSSGAHTVGATDRAVATITGRTPSIVVSPAAASRLVGSGPATATAGVGFTFRVTALDPFNNVATGFRGTVQLTSTDPARPVLSHGHVFSAANAGRSTFSGTTFHSAGNHSIVMTDVVGTLRNTHPAIPVRPRHAAYGWGRGAEGQLGEGVATAEAPVFLGVDSRWRSLSAGGSHSAGIKTDGTLWTWGHNEHGALGDGTRISRPGMRRVGTRADWASVVAGQHRTFAIKTNGTLWAWGNNAGALGDGTGLGRLSPVQIAPGVVWSSVASGSTSTVAVAADGTLWSWGANPFGQLGDGTTVDRFVPARVGTAADWGSVSAGDSHVLALKRDGSLWAWGRNAAGELGDGTRTDRRVPTRIGTRVGWSSVEAGLHASAAIWTDQSLWVWGSNEHGQLGGHQPGDAVVPQQILGLDRWVSVSSGIGPWRHAAVTFEGELWTWGKSSSDGSVIGAHQVSPGPSWLTATAGGDHIMALSAAILP